MSSSPFVFSKVIKYVHLAASVIVLTYIAFYTHRRLQREYYEKCVGDIFQVLLFKNSSFCMLMSNINTVIENTFANIAMVLQDLIINAFKVV